MTHSFGCRYNEGVNCLACGPTDAPASREHVFSAWLLREFDPGIAMALFRLNPDGTNHKVRQEIKLDGFKLKGVCEPCNNGWMSQLEDKAKPIMLDLVHDRRKLDALGGGDRTALARWVAKTAIIESHSVGAECPIEPKHLSWLRKCDDPGRVIVAACKTQWLGFGHIQVGVISDLIGGGKAAGSIT